MPNNTLMVDIKSHIYYAYFDIAAPSGYIPCTWRFIKPLPAKAGRFLLRPPWCDMHGISRYCYNVLEVLSVELRPYNPGLGQGLKVIYFKPQNKEPQNIEVKNIVLFFKKLLLFEIPCSIFDIQNAKHAKAIRLKGEGFKPGEWKNKLQPPIITSWIVFIP